jgi:hypothetical protein
MRNAKNCAAGDGEMGQWLQALKQAAKDEARKSLPAVIRGPQEQRPRMDIYSPSDQPSHYAGQPYGVPASSELSPEQLSMIIAHAKLQGAREELERSRAHVDATHHAHADRMVQVALAAVNKPSSGETRYRGSAYDKRMRRSGEIKFALFVFAALGIAIFIFWVKDNIAEHQAAQSAATAQQSHRHYRRSEEWDDR